MFDINILVLLELISVEEFGEIYFDLSPLMHPSLNWAIHATLSSYITVGISELEDILHVL